MSMHKNLPHKAFYKLQYIQKMTKSKIALNFVRALQIMRPYAVAYSISSQFMCLGFTGFPFTWPQFTAVSTPFARAGHSFAYLTHCATADRLVYFVFSFYVWSIAPVGH